MTGRVAVCYAPLYCDRFAQISTETLANPTAKIMKKSERIEVTVAQYAIANRIGATFFQ
jgi:hypothetical protein